MCDIMWHESCGETNSCNVGRKSFWCCTVATLHWSEILKFKVYIFLKHVDSHVTFPYECVYEEVQDSVLALVILCVFTVGDVRQNAPIKSFLKFRFCNRRLWV